MNNDNALMDELEGLRRRVRELEEALARRGRELRDDPVTMEALMENIPEAVAIVSAPDGIIMMASRESERLLGAGARAEGLSLRNWCEKMPVTHPDGRAPRKGEYPLSAALTEGRAIRDLELVIAGPGSEKTWLLANAGPIFDKAGKLLGAVISWKDITARKITEDEIRRDKELLRRMLAIMPVGVWLMDAEGNIVEANNEARRIWGGARYVGVERFSEYQGWWAETGRKIEAHEWAAARAMERGETSINEEVEIEGFDGARRFILNSAMPIPGDDGEVAGTVIVNQDITARKRFEMELRSSEQMLAEAERIAHVGNWIWDLEKDLFSGTDEAYSMFGKSRDERIGYQEFMETVHPEDRELVDKAIGRSLSGGQVMTEYRIIVGGDTKHVMTLCSAAFQDGRAVSMSGTVQDITERKVRENELKEAMAKIQTLSGLIPICASCKRIRDDKGYWMRIEKFIEERSMAEFTHGLCPECEERYYKEDEAG